MNPKLKTVLRTLQTSFPWFLDTKFALMRRYRNARGIPFDKDFNAIDLFPDTERALYLDVGANRGQSTDAILMKRQNCLVHLFEPNPLLCEKLERQLRGNLKIVINAFGLGEQSAEQALYVPFYKRWMFDGLASFDHEKAKGWLRGRMLFYKEHHLTVREVTCKIRRLDELNLAPFFMKLDVQGYEFQAIKGGAQTIKKHEPVLLVESAPKQQIISFLQELGYQFYAFKGRKFIRGVIGDHNTYFMTASKASLVKNHIESAGSEMPDPYPRADARAHG